MECTVVDRSITKERRRNGAVLEDLRTVPTSARLEQAWPNDTASSHHADLW